jgi:hypothetical protein
MEEQTFQVGDDVFAAADAPGGQRSAIFEDDGETGYFYAVDLTRFDNIILDAVHIYNVSNVVDRDRQSTLSIAWSQDGLKCALLINGYPHAAFDFAAQQGYCRTNCPNFDKQSQGCWSSSGHSWSDDAVAWLGLKDAD